MNKFIYALFTCLLVFTVVDTSTAGNPDRQGEAGALQLLMNPWAKSAGLHTLSTSMISGAEAMRLNVAGLSRINRTEVVLAHTRYLEGTEISFNSFGLAQKAGKNGTFGMTIMAVDVGDIQVTTEAQPEGTGATYSPSLFNLGLGYSHLFENKISVGFTVRVISESTTDVRATGFAVDAGVQYVTGPQDNFKFGISLRNVGSPMKFEGQGLSQQRPNPEDVLAYDLTFFSRSNNYELPSVLNIGTSYDFILNPKNRLTVLANFTSNSFSRDNIGAGLEYAFNDMFMVRGAYRVELGDLGANNEQQPVYSGLAAGLSFEVPMKKDTDRKFALDYAYRVTQPFGGTHNIAVRFNL